MHRGLSRRALLQAAALGAVGTTGVAGTAACGPPSPSTSDGVRSLSLVYLGTAEQQTQWNQLFQEFQRQQPNVRVTAVGLPVDNWAAYADRVLLDLAAGRKYDLVQVATEGMQLFVGKSLLHPLDDLVRRDAGVTNDLIADVSPRLVEWNRQYASGDGHTYFLPGDFNTMCMWYNRRVLRSAGLDDPEPAWSWETFLDYGRKVKKASGAYLYPVTAEYFVGVMPWLLTNGASTLDDTWRTATCDDPRAVEAADFARQLVQDGLSPAPGGSFDRYSLAVQGRLAMFGGGRWPIINIRQQGAVGDFGIVPWPRKTRAGSPVGWGFTPILRSSENKEDAWTFIKFLSSRQGATFFAGLGGTIVPGRRSVASSEAFLANSPRGTEFLYRALDYATPIPSPARNDRVQRSVEDTWGQIAAGVASPAEGMRSMQRRVSADLG